MTIAHNPTFGIPSFVYLDEEDIPTKRFVRPTWEPSKPIPWAQIAYFLMVLVLLSILAMEVYFFVAVLT